jgi:hypothetical protein
MSVRLSLTGHSNADTAPSRYTLLGHALQTILTTFRPRTNLGRYTGTKSVPRIERLHGALRTLWTLPEYPEIASHRKTALSAAFSGE